MTDAVFRFTQLRAGVLYREDVLELDPESWRHTLDINVAAPGELIHYLAPAMVERGCVLHSRADLNTITVLSGGAVSST